MSVAKERWHAAKGNPMDTQQWNDMVNEYAADRGLIVERTYRTEYGYYRAVVVESNDDRIALWARSRGTQKSIDIRAAGGATFRNQYRIGRDGRREDKWDWKSQTRKPTNRGARGGCVN